MNSRRHDILRDDEAGPDDGPERMCAVSRRQRPKNELIRFVLSPDGDAVPDLNHRLPGRGVWVGGESEVVALALKRKVFPRAFKAEVTVASDMASRIDDLMVRQIGNTLSLANKAGLAIAGFQQVDGALEKGSVRVLLHGRDAAADGCNKLDRKFKAIQRDRGAASPVIASLTIEQISLAMGRPSVVHAALIPGGLTDRFLREAERLARYRSPSVVSDQPKLAVSNEGSTELA